MSATAEKIHSYVNVSLAFGLLGLLLAYEWLASGLTKLVHGDFPSGLSADLHDRLHTAGRYGWVLRHVVIPHAVAWGYVIESTEIMLALLFLAGAVLTFRHRRSGLVLAVAAAAVGAFMTVNFGLSDGDRFWRIVAPDSFDEGVPLDVLATWLQVIVLVSAVAAWVDARRAP